MNAVVARFAETVERTYPDGISKVRAIIGARTDLPLGKNVASPVLWSFGVATVNPGGEIARHTHHEREELFYIISGAGAVEAGTETFPAGPGTAIWFPVGCEHRIFNPGTEPVVVIFAGILSPGSTFGISGRKRSASANEEEIR